MARKASKAKAPAANGGANLGFEAKLWAAADALRNNMDAAEYKHVVLGLIFLKYISDAFEAKHAQLVAEKKKGADPEDRDEYRADNIFWVPKEARWAHLKASAPQPTIGKIVDDAMTAIERDNTSLKGVLPKDYARPGLDKQRLGQIINLVSDIALGSAADRAKDTLGRVYEYFLSRFASAEGKSGGQFYTPAHVVRVLVEVLSPYKGRVYDPCCGSGGMFVQSEKFIEAHSGKLGDISIYGQESNYTTWRLAKMNLALRGIDAQIAHGDTFHADKHPDLKADYVLANPHFNDSDWRGELLKDDKRWTYGTPPASNANYAWVQHFIHHLAPTGLAGFVLANGSMSSNQSGEGEIRRAIVEADLVDCMVSLPGQLFYSTQIPVCLWFLARNKKNGRFRDRRGETLFIDARKLGTMADRVHRELAEEDIAKIAGTYHAWRGDKGAGSPLRYPGGKAAMSGLLASIRRLNGLGGTSVAEPFAGGAGASLKLLYLEETQSIYINDADPAIHDFWQCLVNQTEPFLETLRRTRASMAEWRRQKAVYASGTNALQLRRGFAAFYLNRCNHSGSIMNGGPIGGMKQTGEWKIDARYNKEALIERCSKVAEYRDRVEVSCEDGLNFIQTLDPRDTFFFIDPPYFVKGPELYLNGLDAAYHARLAECLHEMEEEAWVLTYDDCPEIRAMYRGWARIRPFSIRYSAAERRPGKEVLITPHWMTLPREQASAAVSPQDEERRDATQHHEQPRRFHSLAELAIKHCVLPLAVGPRVRRPSPAARQK